MSSKNDLLKNLAKLEDDDALYKEYANESERGNALLASAALDLRLRDRIAGFLVDDQKEVDELLGFGGEQNAALGTFGARISAAYCLGLITRQQRDNLRLIKKIRNHFAHNLHGSSFADEPVRSWCASLTFLRYDLELADAPREQFAHACSEIESELRYTEELLHPEHLHVRESTVWDFVAQLIAKGPESTGNAA